MEGGIEYARRDGNADGVVEKRPEEVLLDVADHRSAQLHGGGNVQKVAAHQHDVRRLDGDVRTRADSDADVRTREGGRVVDAVADHGDLFATFLQPPDLALLVLRQHLGHHAIHTDLTANGLGGALVVTCEHDHFNAHVGKLGDRLRACGLDNVCHGDETEKPAIAGEEERRLAVLCERFAARKELAVFCMVRLHHAAVARKADSSFDRGAKALAGDLLKLLDGQERELLLFRFRNDRFGKRVLGALFKRRCNGEEFVPLRAEGQNVGDDGLSLRDGTGLVENDSRNAVRRFQRLGGLDEDPVHCAAPRADHDGRGSCKAECAGAADDEHGNADGEREFHAVPRQEPHRRRDDGNRDDHGDKHAAHLIGKLGDGRFGAGGLVHETYDLGERRIVADLRRAHLEVAGFVDRCADDGVTHLFLDGNALARQRGFIDRGRTLEHHTVDRNALARLDDEHLTGLHLGSGNDALCAVALDGRGLGCKIHELCDRIGGFALGARFHGLTHGDERQDRAGGLKVQLHHIGMHRVHVHLSEADANAIDGIDAVQNGGAGAERDERIHVRRALNERLAAADIILAVEKDDGNEQQKLRKRERHRVLHAEETLRQRPAHHVPH